MAFKVMNAKHGFIECRSHGAGHTRTHQQSTRQARPACEGDGIDVIQRAASVLQHLFGQGQHTADVVAAGQLRHHTAIGAVHFDLAVERMAQQLRHSATLLRTHQGHTRFIARRFDSQNQQTHEAKV
ncbi:hypothetical protein D3C71_1410640 [compost metagenome]